MVLLLIVTFFPPWDKLTIYSKIHLCFRYSNLTYMEVNKVDKKCKR